MNEGRPTHLLSLVWGDSLKKMREEVPEVSRPKEFVLLPYAMWTGFLPLLFQNFLYICEHTTHDHILTRLSKIKGQTQHVTK